MAAFFESPAFEVDVRAAEAFDKDFPRRPKRETPTQRHFQALAACDDPVFAADRREQGLFLPALTQISRPVRAHRPCPGRAFLL